MRRSAGFTLTELVMVIVLLGIVATVSVQFVALSTRGAIDLSARQQRSMTGVVISEQISRQLREALPTSVRTNGDCIEWIPIEAASNYLDLPSGPTPDSFNAVALPANRSATGRIVVYGYGSDVYDISSPGPTSPLATMPAGNPEVTVTFDGGATHRFSAKSPEKRFYVVGDPVTLCQSGQWLYRYRNYGINATIATSLPSTFPDREVLAAGLAANSLNFEVTPPSLQRGAVVSFDVTLEDADSGETTAISQEVQIRNVP
ncbi:type II secretion system protein [Marinobacter sp. CHS3-4]|uniref:PulJ/GspJ family protein n=1 Tax=Marinobacter sp. CHS3-4 TaxID=3045174 RepID=UPI0024B58763|nr:type II secretion system protein [Marinobacter sp. CHS3-4]MDI9246678.1 type II secretion system protein [Marinobacter sp. CHS3-4]